MLTDPDGDVWEIAYNPGFPLDQDGAITITRRCSRPSGR